jgi:glucokinase
MKEIILVGDIGGTNTNLALVEICKNSYKILIKKKIPTKSKKTFEEILNQFLNENQINVSKGILAIAGIDQGNTIQMTNAKHKIKARNILKKTKLKEVELINDFCAIAYSLEILSKKDLIKINVGKENKDGVKTIIGAGTGLGKSIIQFNRKKKNYFIIHSEGGHTQFTPENIEDFNLVLFLQKKLKKKIIEQEDLLSGKGIENIYHYLFSTHKKYQNQEEGLSAKEISLQKNFCSKKTMELFFKYFARFAKNSALNELPRGGIYLAGGIITKNLNFNKKKFIKEFETHPTFKKILKEIPIYILTNYDSSIFGLIHYYLNTKK